MRANMAGRLIAQSEVYKYKFYIYFCAPAVAGMGQEEGQNENITQSGQAADGRPARAARTISSARSSLNEMLGHEFGRREPGVDRNEDISLSADENRKQNCH
jgi:hypothetical protein